MLARWRLFLTSMLLAALPLQGFAAGTMLLCAPAGHGHAVAIAAPHAQAHAGHDHAAHGHPAADSLEHGSPANEATPGDAQHQCNLCASCCHSVGIAGSPAVSRAAGVPRPDLPDPVVPVASHLSPLPERPPRA